MAKLAGYARTVATILFLSLLCTVFTMAAALFISCIAILCGAK